MKLKDLLEQQRIINDDVDIPAFTTTLVGYKHKGIPIAGAIIKGSFSCSRTAINSLEGGPSYVRDLFVCSVTDVSSFEGGPSYVGGDFYCYTTPKITSLHNIHKHIKHIGGYLHLSNTIKSNVLGVMFIKGLKGIGIGITSANTEQTQTLIIINKHLKGDRNIHACQEELLEAGLKVYARL